MNSGGSMRYISHFFIGKALEKTTDLFERARISLCFWFLLLFLFTILLSFIFTTFFKTFNVMFLLGSLVLLNTAALFSIRISGSYKIATILQAVVVITSAVGNSAFTSFSLSILLFIWPVIYTFFLHFLLGKRATLWYIISFTAAVTGISIIKTMNIFPVNPLYEMRMTYSTGILLTMASFFLYFFIRIYERTQNEVITLQLQSLESRDNILHVVAHDLRNTIGTGVGAIDLMKIAFTDNDQELLQKALGYFEKSTDSSLSIVNDLLESAALPTSSKELQLTTIEMAPLLQNLVDQFLPVAANKNITLTFDEPSESASAHIDVDKIKRAFGNLLSNAVKFTQPGGKIDIELSADEQHCIISFRDSGIGIPDDLKKILFFKYSKAGRRGTSGERSIGLGMYIIKSILDVHNANIRVISEVQKGSQFIVELPRTVVAG